MLSKLWLTIAGWSAAIIGVLAILFKVRQSGKDSVKMHNMKEALEGVKTRDKIENNIKSADISERERLRRKWTRKLFMLG